MIATAPTLNRDELSVSRHIAVQALRKASPHLRFGEVATKLGLPPGTAREHYYGYVRPSPVYRRVIANGVPLLTEALRSLDLGAIESVLAAIATEIRETRIAHLRLTGRGNLIAHEERMRRGR